MQWAAVQQNCRIVGRFIERNGLGKKKSTTKFKPYMYVLFIFKKEGDNKESNSNDNKINDNNSNKNNLIINNDSNRVHKNRLLLSFYF